MRYLLYFSRLGLGNFDSDNLFKGLGDWRLILKIQGADEAHFNPAKMHKTRATISDRPILNDIFNYFSSHKVIKIVLNIFIDWVLQVE